LIPRNFKREAKKKKEESYDMAQLQVVVACIVPATNVSLLTDIAS
jgi:hypothetical protein